MMLVLLSLMESISNVSPPPYYSSSSAATLGSTFTTLSMSVETSPLSSAPSPKGQAIRERKTRTDRERMGFFRESTENRKP
ncbi:hypothetical protein ACB098_05G081000 [Castanea mollissima]